MSALSDDPVHQYSAEDQKHRTCTHKSGGNEEIVSSSDLEPCRFRKRDVAVRNTSANNVEIITLSTCPTGSVRHSGVCVIRRFGNFIVLLTKVRQRYENLSNCQILQNLPNQRALKSFLHGVSSKFAFFLEIGIGFYGFCFCFQNLNESLSVDFFVGLS